MTTLSVSPAIVYEEARHAAVAAVRACTPRPMIVGQPTTPLGDDIDHTKPTYYVADGVCGFGYVTIKPARGAFVAFMKAHRTGHKGYYGGWEIPAWAFADGIGQSYEKAMAAAYAVTDVLNKYGIEAFASGRLD